MDEICNICLIERLNLTPLFRNTGDNVFRDTGLSKVVESSRGIKIDNINKSTSMICISCIYQSVVFYHDQFYQGNPPVTPDVLINDSPNQSSHLMNIIENNFYNLVSLSLDMNPHFIDNYNWQKLLSKMIKLKYLKIIEGSPTSKTYADILNVLPIDMKEIHLIPGNYKILLMDDFIKAIEKFNEISNFTLQYCYLNNATIETITRKSKLIKLDLKGCEFERDSSEFANFNNLEYLNLESVKNINDKIIIRISKNCKNLKYLNLKNADNNYYSISSLALCEIGKLKNLEYLNLKNVINIDDDLISNTANRCEKLTYLDINLCTCLSSSTLNNLGKLKNLEYLNIRQLKINPNGIIGITNNCKNLKTLIMTSDNLTANDLQGIVKLPIVVDKLILKNFNSDKYHSAHLSVLELDSFS
ncbi:hypothetical protein HCN44_001181 [Aphidius gifuensis]|uniref:Uncharacterized protein n=1 Tax=Aphidius gifuensis TaxID=684658 RepID=A0A835CNY2_APHGI|nr:hypothetical protein HCN44_001181 [Aphidius gifuensis]